MPTIMHGPSQHGTGDVVRVLSHVRSKDLLVCSFSYHPRDSPLHCMPRRLLIQNTAALVEGVAALDQSLKAVNARLRQARKTAWTQRKHELSARRRLVQQAVAILLLYDMDRSWLPAFMRKRGMGGVDEELSAFDEEVVDHFPSSVS